MTLENIEEGEKTQEWKGVLFINLYSFLLAVCCLLSRVIFLRNPKMQPEEQLGLRTLIAVIMLVIFLNVHLWNIIYESVIPDKVWTLT